MLLDVSIPNKAPKWSGAGVTPGVRGWIAPKLLSLDAGGAADLATYCATLSTQASEATVSDSMYPLGGIGG